MANNSLLRIQRLFKYIFILLFYIISFTLWSIESHKISGLFLYILFSTSTFILLFLDIETSERSYDYTALLILVSAFGLIGSSNIILFCIILNNNSTIIPNSLYSNGINYNLSKYKLYSFIVNIIIAIWCVLFFTTKKNVNGKYDFFSKEGIFNDNACNIDSYFNLFVYIIKILLSILLLFISSYIAYITNNMMKYNKEVNNASIKDSSNKPSNPSIINKKSKASIIGKKPDPDESIENMTDRKEINKLNLERQSELKILKDELKQYEQIKKEIQNKIDKRNTLTNELVQLNEEKIKIQTNIDNITNLIQQLNTEEPKNEQQITILTNKLNELTSQKQQNEQRIQSIQTELNILNNSDLENQMETEIQNEKKKQNKQIQLRLENIIVGDNTKLDGAICNVHFYNTPLTKKSIVNIYNKLRLSDPPI